MARKAIAAAATLAALLSSAEANRLRTDKAQVHEGEETARKEIRKPITDKRTYVHTTFKSGLSVMAVQDTSVKKTAYSLSVEAGSLEDPKDFPGLAHFCEHMVFLASKKYPQEDLFSKLLAKNGGSNNAYTSADATVYYGEVDPEAFAESLDIFSRFFIDPSFVPNMADREVMAVDSEHKKNMPSTSRRLFHLFNMLGNPKSPNAHFFTGSLKTLKTDPESRKLNVTEALHAYHKKHYCPHRMHLVTIGTQSPEEQLKIIHKSFDAMEHHPNEKTCAKVRPTYTDIALYTKEQKNLGQKITIGTKGSPEMWLFFPTFDMKYKYKTSPANYLSLVLGNYAKGSLKDRLKEEDLSHSYSISVDSTRAGSQVFVTFALTEKGEKNTDKIAAYLFAYLNAARKDGIDRKYIDDWAAMNQANWDYQEKSSSVSGVVMGLAGNLAAVEPEDALAADGLMLEIDEKEYAKVMDDVNPDNMNMALVTSSFDDKKGTGYDKYYDFHYSKEPIPAASLAAIKKTRDATISEFIKPEPLPHVPHNFALISDQTENDQPQRLDDQNGDELWWLGPGKFTLPKAIVELKINYARKNMKTAQAQVLGSIHSSLISMALESSVDPYLNCGLSYMAGAAEDGMAVSFSGFNEHLMKMAELVLPSVRTPKFSEDDFEMVRNQMILGLSDTTKGQAFQHAMSVYNTATTSGQHSRETLLAMVKDKKMINVAEHKKWQEAVFKDASLTSMFIGNVDKAASQESMAKYHSLLGLKDGPGPKVKPSGGLIGNIKKLWHSITGLHEMEVQPRELNLLSKESADDEKDIPTVIKPKKEIEIHAANPIHGDVNHATMVAYQYGIPTIPDRIKITVLSDVMQHYMFDILRTKYQLGYTVFGMASMHRDVAEVRVLVQGVKETPDEVARLAESAVQNMTKVLEDMSQEEFNTRKAAVYNDLTKEPANMGEWLGKSWGQISEKTYCFDKVKNELKYMDSEEFKTSKPLVEMWKKMVAPGKDRKKISMKMFGVDKAGKPVVGEKVPSNSKLIVSDGKEETLLNAVSDEERWPHEYICKL
eukprot:TRINITY_DN167_c0_g1_i1.p1 TRINITY_DN167_c0_g1~~TRINITY_DN167_c0_g1_i1.p1  ORF type:complete len:1051 (-),score=281.16 TRINITY_DN167_c0_g1_i1:207-3359(-)